jgi:NitT/TauT family transport system substrate-binding protein
MTQWIQKDPGPAKDVLAREIKKESGKELPASILNAALSRIEFTYDPLAASVVEQANAAHKVGFLKKKPELDGLFDLTLLEEVLQEKGLDAEWTKDVP